SWTWPPASWPERRPATTRRREVLRFPRGRPSCAHHPDADGGRHVADEAHFDLVAPELLDVLLGHLDAPLFHRMTRLGQGIGDVGRGHRTEQGVFLVGRGRDVDL